ncbi:hypothetical protein BC830DRAFT_1168636, partial [Chytriomyces sp. MP71]
GVTLDSTKRKDGSTLLDCGLRGGVPVLIKDKAAKAGVRVTGYDVTIGISEHARAYIGESVTMESI